MFGHKLTNFCHFFCCLLWKNWFFGQKSQKIYLSFINEQKLIFHIFFTKIQKVKKRNVSEINYKIKNSKIIHSKTKKSKKFPNLTSKSPKEWVRKKQKCDIVQKIRQNRQKSESEGGKNVKIVKKNSQFDIKIDKKSKKSDFFQKSSTNWKKSIYRWNPTKKVLKNSKMLITSLELTLEQK